MPPEIVVHHLEQARAALEAADALERAVQLRSAPGAAAYAGVGYLHALGDALGHELLIDCHDDAGLVMAALRAGCRKLVFFGPADLQQRLSDMAAQHHAELRLGTEPAPPCLALLPDDDSSRRVRAWLSGLPEPSV